MVGIYSELICYCPSAKWITEPGFERIVRSTVIVGVEKFLKPLNKLKIVLKPALYQFIDWYYLQKGRMELIESVTF